MGETEWERQHEKLNTDEEAAQLPRGNRELARLRTQQFKGINKGGTTQGKREREKSKQTCFSTPPPPRSTAHTPT